MFPFIALQPSYAIATREITLLRSWIIEMMSLATSIALPDSGEK